MNQCLLHKKDEAAQCSVWTICSMDGWFLSWLSNTFSMRRLDYWEFIHPKCPYGNLSATCWDACVLNLSIILSNYHALCLEIREGSVLLSGALSRFDNLKSLYIQGCPPTILPETFQGAVQGEDTLYCSKCYNSLLLSNTFTNLTNLEELSINNYRLSVMAPDALGGI